MGSSFGSYQIAKSGMYVSERGLDVTGHNIANSTTIGYSRQQSIQKNSFYQGVSSDTQIGTGADIAQTRQIRNIFLDNIYRRENQLLGYSDAKNKTYTEIQNILAEPINDGLQVSMNNYWDSWQELAKDPSSLTVRALVRQRGQALSDYANNMGKQLKRLQSDINSEIISNVDEVNNITSQIAALNVDIPKYEACGDQANDLRDQRSVLLDRLTNLIDADVIERQNGSVDISVGGYMLVNRENSSKIELESADSSDIGIYYTPKMEGTKTDLQLKGGTIKGLMESCKEIVPGVRKRLNTLIGEMAKQVNDLQGTGSPIGKSGTAGTDFFDTNDDSTTITIDNIEINSNLSDLNNIISSKSGDKGDNTIALQIANLRNVTIDDLNKLSLDSYYQGIIQDVGGKAQEISTFTESQSGLVDSANNQRSSISGVSMDEELTRMLKYQFAYGGASKAFNAIDEMVNTVISKMGLVGR